MHIANDLQLLSPGSCGLWQKSQQTVVPQIWMAEITKRFTRFYDFPVYDFTQEKIYFFFHRLTIQMTVSVKKD